MIHVRVTAVALSLALSGCITPPTIDPEQPTIPNDRLGLTRQLPAPTPAPDWWSAFNDQQLDHLMQQALAANPSLAQTMARLREAQSFTDVTRAGLAPSLAFDARETRQQFSGHDVIPKPYAGTVQWEGHEGGDLSWDLDFWGRQASWVKRARSQAAAAALDVTSARLALSAAVAQAYIDLYRDNALAEVAERTEAQRQRILEITRQRLQSGLDTNVELREASAAVPEAHVKLLQARAAVALDTHQLAALSGHGADIYAQVGRPTLDPAAILPLPASLPADLLGHRPDVLAARERIEATRAGQAAAKAAFYPDINLVAFAGTSAIGFANLFQGASGAYGAGPAIHLPLFDAGQLRAEYRGAAAELDDAVAGYNQAVLQAVRETSDQLSLARALQAEIAEQQRSLDDAEGAYQLSEERYRAGLSSYLRDCCPRGAPGARDARGGSGRRTGQSTDRRGRQLRSDCAVISFGTRHIRSPFRENNMSDESNPASTKENVAPAHAKNKRRLRLITLGLAASLGAAVYGSYWLLFARHYQSTDDAYVNGDLVQITSEVPGTVIALKVDDTQAVGRGQTLLTLDPADAQVAMSDAEAGLARAVREVRTLLATAEELRARIADREIELKRAEDDYRRRSDLLKDGAVSSEELSHTKDSIAQMRANLTEACEQLNATTVQIDGTTLDRHPLVLAAEAAVRAAALALRRTRISAPVAGVVARRSVQVGQRVAPGTALMAVVPLDDVWVDANFKEVQLKDMRVGQPVHVRADVYGESVNYHGKLVGLSAGSGSAFALLPAQNASGNWIKIVQRVPVRIALDPEELKAHPLRVGLSMTATVDVRDTSGTLIASQVRSVPIPVQPSLGDDPEVEARIARILAANGGAGRGAVVARR